MKIWQRKPTVQLRSLLPAFLLLVLALPADADSFDQMALQQLRATLKAHRAPDPEGPITNKTIHQAASQLMMIKNAMSLFRDGYLSKADIDTLKQRITGHLKFSKKAQTAPGVDVDMAGIVHKHAVKVGTMLVGGREASIQTGRMAQYHSTIGITAYTTAQSRGIEQVWIVE